MVTVESTLGEVNLIKLGGEKHLKGINVASLEYKSDGKRGSITQLSILPARDLKTETKRWQQFLLPLPSYSME